MKIVSLNILSTAVLTEHGGGVCTQRIVLQVIAWKQIAVYFEETGLVGASRLVWAVMCWF